jgi:hypothetical protein
MRAGARRRATSSAATALGAAFKARVLRCEVLRSADRAGSGRKTWELGSG